MTVNTSTEYAKIVLIPVPWEGTTKTNKDTALAPTSILEAFKNLDRDSVYVKGIEQIKIIAVPTPEEIYNLHRNLKDNTTKASLKVNEFVYNQVMSCFRKDEIPIIVGGESSVSFSAMEAASKKVPIFDVFHISGQQNLCNAFGGQIWSERSTMFNVATRLSNVGNIIQVGTKSFAKEEEQYCSNLKKNETNQLFGGMLDGIGKINTQITTYHIQEITKEKFQGKTWCKLCHRMISDIREHVWLSIDLSVFNSAQRSDTGSASPGGLDYDEVIFLLKLLAKSGRKILGFDIVGSSAGAKDITMVTNLLFEVSGFVLASHKKIKWK